VRSDIRPVVSHVFLDETVLTVDCVVCVVCVCVWFCANLHRGTEGNLRWAAHPKLRDDGRRLGRQYVAFTKGQAYPELVIDLARG
jgi:hypothetical protein